MILITGLGNPGNKFKSTRHNIGFEIIDSIHTHYKFPIFRSKFDGLYSKKNIFGENIVIFKPQTFMNLSGQPIKIIRQYFKLDKLKDLIVIHDDIDMDFLKIRIKTGGGHGGHNGVRDIIKYNGKDFYRVKFGIKNEIFIKKKLKTENFVLDSFIKKEIEKI